MKQHGAKIFINLKFKISYSERYKMRNLVPLNNAPEFGQIIQNNKTKKTTIKLKIGNPPKILISLLNH